MASIETKLKSLALSLDADIVGIASRGSLAGGPPSADPCYLLPSANSVISFAVSLDSDLAKEFISKKSWRPHCDNRKTVVQTLYTIGDRISEQLQSEGYEAINVDINNNYRPEKNATNVTEMTEFHPDFSHRYAAVAAGIGRLGWSGNLLTTEYGALVELGSVLTTADLKPDTPIGDDQHPCNGCKICSKVCPVGMIQPQASTHVKVAGVTEKISRKRPNTCCWIGCTGYQGLAASGKWSNWSPYRIDQPLPESKDELDALCISLQKADPQMQASDNTFDNYRNAVFDPEWFYYTVCGFCRIACMVSIEERIANRKLIANSGTAVLKLDGCHEVANGKTVEVQTPFGMRVEIPTSELSGRQPKSCDWPGQFPLDREVIQFLSQQNDSEGAK